jgi:D-alanine-D-alanine ligase
MAQLAIGLVYDLLGSYPRRPGDPPDAEAEYEPEATLLGLEDAIRRLGHRPVRLGRPAELLAAAGKGQVVVDAALTIAEGHGSRNREAWAPVLLEMLAIPQLGSDALTLSLSLDKAWTRAVVAEAGVPVAPAAVARSAAQARELDPPGGFPCFVKPRWEGTAKGITARSRVEDRDALVHAVTRVVERYGQPALVEHFLPGAEYTVTVVGHAPPRTLPVLQRALDARTRIGVHALTAEGGDELESCTPGRLDPALEAGLEELALRAFEAMECRDFARLDFKLDAKDRPVFLEINPLPTFALDGSFGILAELEGRSHAELVAEVIGAALGRLGLAP